MTPAQQLRGEQSARKDCKRKSVFIPAWDLVCLFVFFGLFCFSLLRGAAGFDVTPKGCPVGIIYLSVVLGENLDRSTLHSS